MKHLTVPRLEFNAANMQQVSDVLNEQQPHLIDCPSCADQYPEKPYVEFSIAHSCHTLYLQYEVHENELLALVEEDNGRVWTDSCVEFFVSFDEGDHYYNFEFNCIGTTLVGYRQAGHKATHAPLHVLNMIQRLPSLGTHVRERTQGNLRWMLTVAIPIGAFWVTNLSDFSGCKAKANFYKCGDHLTLPHFLSWSKVGGDKPNFHQPQFFGQLNFE